MSLPATWAVTTLGDVRADSGKSIDPRQHQSTEFVLYSVPRFDSGAPEILAGSEIGSSKQTVAPGTVLLCKINPRINRVWVVEPHSEGPIIASTEWIPFFETAGIRPKYLAYFLQQNEVRDYLAHNVSGVGGSLMRVRPTVVDRLEFRLAPETEQDRIVAEIEKQFTRLDDAVVALKRVQANLKRYRASVLKAACEGRLVPTEAELARKEGRDYEPASELLKRILAERRAKWEADQLQKMIVAGKPPKDDRWKQDYPEPYNPDTSLLPQLPTGWMWASVEQLGTNGEQAVLTGPFGTQLGSGDFTDSGVPVLTIGCLTEGGLTLARSSFVKEQKATQLQRYRLRAGDLLFSRMAAVGRAGLVTPQHAGALFNYHIMRLRLNDSVVNPSYFIAYVRGARTVTDYIREVNHGATRDGINTEQLLSLPVALPPFQEQRRITAELECRLSQVEKNFDDCADALHHAARLRQSVLRQAFAGKLVPQNPNDEPASVLLRRIRAERARAQAGNGKAPKSTNSASPANGQRQRRARTDSEATKSSSTENAQRRRRVAKLAQRVSAGKG